MQLLEIAGRVLAIYVVCMVLLRVVRRNMSELGPMDLLTMLLVSETVSNAMTGGDNSLLGGIVAATTLLVLSALTEVVVFRSRRAETVIQGRAVVLIREGHVASEVMRRFMITDDDLHSALHEHGLLSVDQVKRAYVEADGHITIVKTES